MKSSLNRLSITLFIADIFWVCLGLYVATQIRMYIPIGGPLKEEFARLPIMVYPLAIMCWSFSLIKEGAYNPQKILRAVNEIRCVLMASLLAALLLAGTLYLTFREVSRFQFIYFFLITTFLVLLYRGLVRIYSRYIRGGRIIEPQRVLILGAGDLGLRVAKTILNRSRWGMELIGFLDDDSQKQGWQPDGLEGKAVLGTIDQVINIVKENQIENVYFTLPARAYKRLEKIVIDLQKEAVNIQIVPDYFSLALVHAQSGVMGGLPVISLRAPVIEGTDRIIKRIFDVVVSIFLLFLLSPLLIFIVLWISLDSPGPAIFRQQRVGENGKLFTMFKFRTMVQDAESRQVDVNQYDQEGNIIHKHPDDPRVTKLGRLLRKTSLDELPQLFNVLRGEMSLVGPRPELPWLVEKYEPWQRKRFAVPQGITGWWQVNKREKELMHLSTKDDLYYVYNYSIFLDIRILFMTAGALFRGY